MDLAAGLSGPIPGMPGGFSGSSSATATAAIDNGPVTFGAPPLPFGSADVAGIPSAWVIAGAVLVAGALIAAKR